MEKTTFLILFVIWVVFLFAKRPLLKLLQQNDILVHITHKTATYFMLFLLAILIIAGMLFTSTTEITFGNVSDGFEKVRNSPEQNKPHRFFNIDFDLIFPKGNE
jgi:amino acid transporter